MISTITIQVTSLGAGRVRRAVFDNNNRLLYKEFLTSLGKWEQVEEACEIPDNCVLACESRNLKAEVPATTAREIWVDGVKFVPEKSEPLFTVSGTPGSNYCIQGSPKWWACSHGQDVTIGALAADALREHMRRQRA